MDLQTRKTQNFHHHHPSIVNKLHAYAFSFLVILLTILIFCNILSHFNPRTFLGIAFRSPFQPPPCDYSNGNWVFDDGYPLQKYTENCRFLDPGFRCHQNGRLDQGFRNWRWQPYGCDLPRFNASDFLGRSRNGRIVFAGDSIARNQWESLLCMLAQAISNQSTIYEENGSPITKHKGYLSIRFLDYNLTVQYYRAPFLVGVGRPPVNSSAQVRRAIWVDKLHWFSERWVGANVLIFSGGHWWNDDKTVKVGSYFQEGGTINMTMDYKEAFWRSLKTWKSWAMQNLDRKRTHIFFRSFSSVHYRWENPPGSGSTQLATHVKNGRRLAGCRANCYTTSKGILHVKLFT
ncbi:hypothetical protein Nepgr_011813 [Nepenthes gracilis]|uniref:Trichome birefringence-like N-terminal domain-containing protein n=1 Tax=Nepenthes gracilis TaxID=150966 RepID=A0AAD3XMA1_NEPGR|nr:hypothetical protein Nepgr_011813 [Nepenthes gracilis]